MLLPILMIFTALVGYRRHHVPEEKQELIYYFEQPFPRLQVQVDSIKNALAGLVDEGGATPPPPAETALALLDKNVIPSIALVLEQAHGVSLNTTTVRAIHVGFVQAIEVMRTEARALRDLFADPALPLDNKRYRAARHLKEIAEQFERFNARVLDSWKEFGIRVKQGR